MIPPLTCADGEAKRFLIFVPLGAANHREGLDEAGGLAEAQEGVMADARDVSDEGYTRTYSGHGIPRFSR